MERLDLSLEDTDDLLAELKRRYDTMVFIGIKNRTETETVSHCDWNTPSILEGIGAVDWVQSLMRKQWGDSRRDAPEL